MKYFIDNLEVKQEEFNNRLQEEIDNYIPLSEYYPKKDEVRESLQLNKRFKFPVYDKSYKDRIIFDRFITFIACEEDILEMEQIIIDNQYDPLNEDSFNIAVSLYNRGYRKVIK